MLLVLVICHVTMEITSKEVSIYFVNYDTLTTLTSLRYGQTRRSLGPPTWLVASKIEVTSKERLLPETASILGLYDGDEMGWKWGRS